MKLKTIVLAGVLAIFSMSLALAKTYDVSFASATKVGDIQLKAGQYRMSVTGTKVTFTSVDSQKSLSTEGKIGNADKKFEETRVDATTEGTTSVVKEIELGGSKIKI